MAIAHWSLFQCGECKAIRICDEDRVPCLPGCPVCCSGILLRIGDTVSGPAPESDDCG
ncbi:hypothetical protein LCGC14_1098950 [marine sediment metagenome]|uniref:Uncharacterized protein n=1 Tax=marine sediment metagenome TaxID=412755 RepID=A0A0F9MY14_9ZZZZ